MPSRIYRWLRRSNLWKANSGTTVLELAVVAPAFFAMLFGATEFGRLAWTQSSLLYAVQQAARCGSLGLPQCATTAGIQSYAAGNFNAESVAASKFLVSGCADSGTKVSISLPFTFVLQNMFPWRLTLSSQSCYPSTVGS